MRPLYFRLTFADFRPYAVLGDGGVLPDGMARYERNSGKWYDVIRGDKLGLVISERFVDALHQLNRPYGALREYRPFLETATGSTNPPPLKYYHWNPDLAMPVKDEVYAETSSRRVMRFIPTGEVEPFAYGLAKGATSNCLFCDIDIVLLARRFKLSNLWFRPLDVPHVDPWSDFEIDYGGAQWPPAWYPSGFDAAPSNLVDADLADPRV